MEACTCIIGSYGVIAIYSNGCPVKEHQEALNRILEESCFTKVKR